MDRLKLELSLSEENRFYQINQRDHYSSFHDLVVPYILGTPVGHHNIIFHIHYQKHKVLTFLTWHPRSVQPTSQLGAVTLTFVRRDNPVLWRTEFVAVLCRCMLCVLWPNLQRQYNFENGVPTCQLCARIFI